jgi:hypothetical protein
MKLFRNPMKNHEFKERVFLKERKLELRAIRKRH